MKITPKVDITSGEGHYVITPETEIESEFLLRGIAQRCADDLSRKRKTASNSISSLFTLGNFESQEHRGGYVSQWQVHNAAIEKKKSSVDDIMSLIREWYANPDDYSSCAILEVEAYF